MAFQTDTRAAGASRGIGRASRVVELPAVLASAGVLVVAAGPYSAVALAVWLLGGLVGTTRAGERVVLRCRGFRSLSSLQRRRLQPVAAAALAMSGMRRGDIDWYVLPGTEPNAFAAGRRAVAVSTGLLADLGSGRLSEPMVRAVLVHELGHHATAANRYALAVHWLAMPWRIWSRFVVGVCVAIAGRRQLPGPLVLVMAAAVVVAVVKAVHRGDWVTASALCVLTVGLLAVPPLEAMVARRGECAADRFAADAGVGTDLACALSTLNAAGNHGRTRLLDRLLARHPEPDERIASLLTPRRPREGVSGVGLRVSAGAGTARWRPRAPRERAAEWCRVRRRAGWRYGCGANSRLAVRPFSAAEGCRRHADSYCCQTPALYSR